VSQVLKWLNTEAEESVSQFEVLASDITGILEQQAACDELCAVAKVLLFVYVCVFSLTSGLFV